jgi:hypothetical protein
MIRIYSGMCTFTTAGESEELFRVGVPAGQSWRLKEFRGIKDYDGRKYSAVLKINGEATHTIPIRDNQCIMPLKDIVEEGTILVGAIIKAAGGGAQWAGVVLVVETNA